MVITDGPRVTSRPPAVRGQSQVRVLGSERSRLLAVREVGKNLAPRVGLPHPAPPTMPRRRDVDRCNAAGPCAALGWEQPLRGSRGLAYHCRVRGRRGRRSRRRADGREANQAGDELTQRRLASIDLGDRRCGIARAGSPLCTRAGARQAGHPLAVGPRGGGGSARAASMGELPRFRRTSSPASWLLLFSPHSADWRSRHAGRPPLTPPSMPTAVPAGSDGFTGLSSHKHP